MTLGEKITLLRKQHHLSQGDLAEQMKVSRQSVSKWETDVSIPDLDKLILMSNLFGVTIDEMVKQDTVQQQPAEEQTVDITQGTTPKAAADTQRTMGFILISVGLVSMLIAFVFAPVLVLFPYMILCGILCLTVKRHVGIVIGWVTLIPILIGLPLLTSIRLNIVFHPFMYQNGVVIQLVIAFILWVAMISLIVVTVRLTPLRKQILLIIGWIVFWNMKGFLPILWGTPYKGVAYLVLAIVAAVLLLALVFFTGKAVSNHQKNKG